MDNSQAASGSHVANAVFVVAVPAVKLGNVGLQRRSAVADFSKLWQTLVAVDISELWQMSACSGRHEQFLSNVS